MKKISVKISPLLFIVAALTANPVFANGEGDKSLDESANKSEPRHFGKGKRGYGKHHKRMSEKKLSSLDKNDDGKVDLNEYLADAEQRFNNLDANQDGYVTTDEARAKHEQMRAKHKEMRAKHKEMRKRHEQERKALREESRGND